VKLGILETDTLDADINKKYGSYAEMFQRLFLSVDNKIEFNVYRVIEGIYPERIEECDAYLITGSKSSAYDCDPWIISLCNYVTDLHKQKKKLIGICFGHQLIAHALGGRVEKSEKGWGVGNIVSNIEINQPWMNNPEKQFSLLVSHQDQVVQLPECSTLIAANEFCPNAAFQIENHILTFQGHPEFLVEYLEYLMNKRKELIGKEKFNIAVNSLQQKNDGKLVAQWAVNFIADI